MSAQRELESPLLPAEQSEDFTSRWRDIQTSFVDEPRDSVEKADELVGDMMQRLATPQQDAGAVDASDPAEVADDSGERMGGGMLPAEGLS